MPFSVQNAVIRLDIDTTSSMDAETPHLDQLILLQAQPVRNPGKAGSLQIRIIEFGKIFPYHQVAVQEETALLLRQNLRQIKPEE